MPILTVRAIEAHKPRAQPHRLTLDRGLQLRIAPDGVRTLLVRYVVKGSEVERQEGLTLAKALREYVEKKRRAKDGLPLKTRTRNDYLAMLNPGKTSKAGKTFIDGELYPLADKMLSRIAADNIRGVCTAQLKYSLRQAVHAMQVMRAALRWRGVIGSSERAFVAALLASVRPKVA